MERPVISVVTTAYNAARHISDFLREMTAVLDRIEAPSEIVVVEDGSRDDTVALIEAELARYPTLRLVRLSRNFGQEPAIFAGLRQARGDFVFLIDSDLEEPPATLIDMMERMRTEAPTVDVVYGVQRQRSGTLQHTFFGPLFRGLFRSLTDIDIPSNILVVRLMTRRYVDAVLLHDERTLALAGIFHLAGFRQLPLLIDKTYKGYSSYSFMKRLRVAIRYLIIFSNRPAFLITSAGFGFAFIAFLYSIFIVVAYLAFGSPVVGWASLAVLITFFSGLLLMSVGVCAAYLAFIFQEVKKRPLAIVQEIRSAGGDDARPPLPAIRDAARPPEETS